MGRAATELREAFGGLPDLLPKCDLGRLGGQLANSGQHRLQIWLLQMPLQMGLAGPVLVEEEQRGIIQRLMQVVIQAPVILAARGDQGEQFLPDLAFLPRLGFELGNYRKRFSVHGVRSSRGRPPVGNAEFR